MRDLPTGTVTLLFTDVEGGTRLLSELGPQRYNDVVIEHRRRLREAFAENHGVELRTEGDSFFAAFERAADAVAAARQVQRSIGDLPLKVRIGIHTGEPMLVSHEDGYVGLDVHRAARIMSAAHGGQVLLSQATRDLLDWAATVRDLGRHRLKDLTQPERIYQLGNQRFPALRSASATNLPAQPTVLVGREREVREVLGLIEGARVITLTGAGGAGKTRLALQAGADVAEKFEDGVFWVSLAAIKQPELVLPTVAASLGAKGDLADFVGEKRLLLLLDNLEQVLDCAPALADLLRSTPNLKLLVTSRAPLRIGGEQEYEVPPLSEAAAIELFTQRASQVNPNFAPDDAVGEISRRLDGLPLAIELAAARTKLLSPQQILERVGRSLDVVKTEARDLPERQRTLRATIDWSYNLLHVKERSLLARLSVFGRSFDLEAAEEVCQADLDLVERLIGNSLLRRRDERLSMLETIRDFALERLMSSGEADELRRRHLRYFVVWTEAERAVVSAGGSDAERYRRLQLDETNIRIALESALELGADDDLLRLVAATWRFFMVRGYLEEAKTWIDEALVRQRGSTEVRAYVTAGRAAIAMAQGDFNAAERFAAEELRLYEELGDAGWKSGAMRDLAGVTWELGDVDRALVFARRALAIAEGTGDPSFVTPAAVVLGTIELELGHLDVADELLARALVLAKENPHEEWLAFAHAARGFERLARGDALAAESEFRQALLIASRLEYGEAAMSCLYGLAAAAVQQDELINAAHFLGAADRLGVETKVHRGRLEERARAEARTGLERRLGAARSDAEVAAGTRADFDDVLRSAFGEMVGGPHSPLLQSGRKPVSRA